MTADVGAQAPGFDLESDAGERVTLGDYAGQWLVLYFYPRDSTPGCTREAQAFTEALARFRRAGAEVAGVSRDSVKSHGSFRDKYAITFPLLSDPELRAHKAYGTWGKKMMYGKAIEGTIRSTFLIAPDGRIARAWSGVKVDGHADAVLAALADASGGAPKIGPAGPVKAKAKAPPAKVSRAKAAKKSGAAGTTAKKASAKAKRAKKASPGKARRS
jgi:peroxiredoxin Q/BCP